MSLQVWLPLNGDIKNHGLLGDFTVGITPVFTSGKLSQALSSGSLTMTPEQTASVLNNNEVSFCFWIKPIGTGHTLIFGTDNMVANNNRKFSIFQYPTANDLHLSWMNDAASATFLGTVVAGAFPSNTWTHCTITYKNPVCKVYLNGELRTTLNGVSNSSSFAYNTQLIHNNAARLLNDFRIYNHCLSLKEIKEVSQELVYYYPLNEDINTSNGIIEDCSGYKNDGGYVGNISNDSSSLCNNLGMTITNSNVSDNTSTGLSYIYSGTQGLTNPDAITIAFWLNLASIGYQDSGVLSFSKNTTMPMDYNASLVNQYDGVFRFNDVNGNSVKITDVKSLLTTNEWHHYAFTFDGQNVKAYKDGELQQTQSFSSTTQLASFKKIYLGYSAAGGSHRKSSGKWSDFRIYATALNAEDIKDLVKTSVSIDNAHNIYGHELIETDNLNFEKTGVINCEDFIEYHEEADGSLWYQVAHHYKTNSKLFSSTDDFTNGVYLDEDRWVHMNICNELTSWEFLYVQYATNTSAPVKYRWKQTVNPFTATYSDVQPGNVTNITTTGYVNGGMGGLYKINSNTAFCIANTNNGNWFGAVGSWAKYGAGIPGYPNTSIAGGYDLYVRIDNTKASIRKLGFIDANNFYEI